MKKIIIALVVLLALVGVWKIYTTRAPESASQAVVGDTVTDTTVSATGTPVSIDGNMSNFSFTGYGPGKEETGTFKTASHNLFRDGNKLHGSVSFDTASVSVVKEDAEKKASLEKHLCAEDLIDCAKYPTTTFTLTSLEVKNGTSTAFGVLSFRGVEKELSFPVTIQDDFYSAEIRLDITPFGLKYTGIKNEVLIKFLLKIS
ncbi:MAG TPA: YceI family protein [Candidatus Paceibacterota bacterium]|jgi:polyisoprenoid-binding protein YceI|nr:YceI family protein [Candidatus Paceibacterota bacterium]